MAGQFDDFPSDEALIFHGNFQASLEGKVIHGNSL
jgi:hypothetical protein